MANKDEWLERIRKLLAKAEDPGCPAAEAAALNDKAAELIAKYGIDRALAYADATVPEAVGDRVLVLDDPYSRAKAQLLTDIAAPLRVRVIWNVGASRHQRGFKVHMFGCESDLDRTEVLFTSLLVQASFGMARVRPDYRSTRQATAAFRRDWLAGFGQKVAARLREFEQRAAQRADSTTPTGPGMAPVLKGRDEQVEQAIKVAYPDLGPTVRGRAIGHSGAFGAGVRAGEVADLGTARISSARRAIAAR